MQHIINNYKENTMNNETEKKDTPGIDSMVREPNLKQWEEPAFDVMPLRDTASSPGEFDLYDGGFGYS
jgi:hypothetical protein